MLEILQTDTKQGTVTPTEIADNILNIMGNTHTHTLLDSSVTANTIIIKKKKFDSSSFWGFYLIF